MDPALTAQTDAISALELIELERLRGLSLAERSHLLEAACRSAAEVEASRQRMGLPPAQPAPWPESTWNYLAQWARCARKQ